MTKNEAINKETVRGVWNWWTDELKAMLPAGLKGDPTKRDRFDIYMETDGTVIETVTKGAGEKMIDSASLVDLPDENWSQIATLAELHKPRLFLDISDYLLVPVTLPKASGNQIYTVLELQIAHLVPLEPHLIDWSYIELERYDEKIELVLVVAKSARLDALETLFAEQDLMPPVFCVKHNDKTAVLRRPLEVARKPLDERKSQLAMVILAMIAMIPILTIGGAKMMVDIENDRITKLESKLAPRLADDRRILFNEMTRRAAAPLLNMPSASNRLESLAKYLSNSDWTVAVTQNRDSSFEFIADMENRETTEALLKKARSISKFKPIEEIPTEDARTRVRYQVGG